MLPRTLEPELMDTAEDASEYDAMDHAAVNDRFVVDLLAAMSDWSLERPVKPTTSFGVIEVLDLGAGTAQIPVELARRAEAFHITAVDAAESMLAVGGRNVDTAGLTGRIELVLADAKRLPFDADVFPVVISNSIVHHLAEPQQVLAEAVRVVAPGGLLFHRDLARPDDEAQLHHLVTAYAGDATPYQRKLFADSLRAALTVEEMQQLVAALGFPAESVRMTSDRHWTWTASK
jgi:ubiquinone/menaquinone biosynthesis C-methylase UbiE